MRITILGSAAGGGFPQWNCNCRNCAGLRAGTLRAKPRTQSSIFVRPDAGDDGVLFNASPDILEQIRSQRALQPARALRDSAIAGVVLIDAQIDHATGLFMLRERTAPLPLWCTDPVAQDLSQGNPVLRVLSHYCGVARQTIPIDGSPFELPGLPELSFRALALSGKAAPYSPHREHPVAGDNIGVTIRDRKSGKSLFYAPGLGAVTPPVFDAMAQADAVMVDGTFWSDDEMLRLGVGSKRAHEIGHLPQSGAGGMIEWLNRLPAGTRRMLIHINNTNPILDEDSAERATLARAGIEPCEDAMTLQL
ncbi:pyrroloquinoline quinone biosynthesis protein PqqB [Verminephrobacter aporrectodeae subsp. tuberculatae]|uniref:Coenzyme PQQ synthesis protein B n=1 Tax=Verminephrobacter aporrectodeae subsp. tuberculatae TaxID=1110392 RepID=A0ABT3KYA1_9BURK|nr:pyrroloquinoline quinone biosynthesis protein PqqB [Verminephrobacter aporrectodeae]MCW5322879.1 pyrroloquinoline quinone biosynthesis protein PqqB [Verminephrobacter aporrectodeae subsp. tuberculatae]